jgi:hypothetical protein
MKRPTQNFTIDTIAFIGFVLLSTTGVLMRYVLPPGSGRFKTVWGLDRHEWGSIHFWIALVFLGILAIHLVLHWRWIVTFITARPREGSGLRAGLGVVGLVGLMVLSFAPLLSPIETTAERSGKGVALSQKQENIQILGSMTLSEVEKNTEVPAEHIIQRLGIPSDIDKDERLGKLKRKFGFTMDAVRNVVRNYEKGK